MKSILISFIFLISQIAFAQQQCFTNCSSGSCITTCNPTNTQNLGDAFANGLKSGQDIGNSIRQNREAQQRADQLQQQQQQQSQTQQANADAAKQAMQVLKDKQDGFCADPANQAYYAKTGCKPNEITFDQQLDKSKISSSEKLVLKDLYPKLQTLSREAAANMRTYYGPKGIKGADLVEGKMIPQSDKNNLELYSGKITWGDYNTRRKEIFDAYMAEFRSL